MTAVEANPAKAQAGGARIPTPQEIADIVIPIARKHGLTSLYLFGSMARGDAVPESDVDLIYGTLHNEIDDETTRRSVREFRREASDALGRDVDLVRESYIRIPKTDPYERELQRLFLLNLKKGRIIKLYESDAKSNCLRS